MQVTDADMPLSSPALISCQHFKLHCSCSSETSLFLHWLELIYSTKTQWVCLKDADSPLTFLNSFGFKSNPQGEQLFLTAHQGWSNTPVASAGSCMNCARGWYCGRVFKQKGTNFQVAFQQNWPRQAPPEWRGNVLCSEREISWRSAWAGSPSAGDPLQTSPIKLPSGSEEWGAR